MFYTLHRAVKFLFLCCWLFVAWKLYQHRRAMEPAVIWYEVWENGGFREKPKPTVSGVAESVLNSQTFTLKTTNNAAFLNVRLLGLRDPSKEQSLDVIEKEKKRRDALDHLIKGRQILLHLGYENFNNVGGIALLGKTNVNAWLVQKGFAFTDQELVKGYPKEIQYQMLWSKRHAVSKAP
jgi:hypothetical protein